MRQALGHPKTGDEITRTLKGKSPTSRKSAREMGHPLSPYFFTVLGTLRALDKNFAGQCCQCAGSQGVLDETLGLRRAGRIHLHAFDAQFQGALDVAELHDFDAGGQRGGAAR